ncbi:MAG: TolC family protein [Lentisphaeria bacterium]|nr:TolC family protein [Lentisphaeria bacterium]
MSGRTFTLAAFGILAAVIAGGCKTAQDYRDERAEYAVKHFEFARYREMMEGQKLSLKECIRMALDNNLELKVMSIEENVAKEMRTAEMLGMLPELNISDSFTGRSNTPASSSKKVADSGLTYGYSTSQDRNVNYFNIDLALSVVDFGLAYFNTQQARDRVMIREQRTRRARQNLTFDVVKAYFQVAAAQRAIKITTGLLEDCRSRYQLIEKLSKSRAITPFRAFDETKRFVEMEKRLTNYIRSYENSCVELRSLLGMHPGGKILVDDSYLNQVPKFEFPEIELMEQIALLERPELYEIDMQKHVNVLECRKEIVKMFPNVRLFYDFVNSNNSFLYHASWYELGIRAAYNLLKLPQHIKQYQAYSAQVDAEETRTFSLAIGIMAQVRIAHANLISVKERYEIDNKVYTAYSKNLKWALASRKLTGDLSNLELDHMRLATAETEIERLMSLGNVYVAYFRILNCVGISKLDAGSLNVLRAELVKARERAAEELGKAADEHQAKMDKLAADAKKAAADDFQTVEKPVGAFGDIDFIAIYDADAKKK